MSEQLHQRLQRHPGVNQSGGVGVPQRMWSDLAEVGGFGGAGQLVAQRLRGDAAALVDQQELGRTAGARVRQRPAGGAPGDDPVGDVEGFLVEGHHAFGGQFAQRHLQPGAVPGDLVHAVQLEVAQLTETQSGGAGEQQRVGVQPRERAGPGRGQLGQGGGQPAVGVRREVAGQRVRGVRDVAGEDQRSGRGRGPVPFGDFGEELADGEDLPAPVPERVRPPVRMVGGGQRGQPGFDVCAPVQRGRVGDRRVAG